MKLTSVNDPDRIQATFDEIDGLCIVISSPTAPTVHGLILKGMTVVCGTAITFLFLALRVADFVRNHDPAVFAPPPGIVLVMLVTLACVIGFAYSFRYELRRREVIQVDGFNLKLAWHGFLLRHRRARVFALKDVRNLRYSPSLAGYNADTRASNRSVAFDYPGSTVHVGLGVPEKESRRIIKTIKDRYKIAADADEALSIERV